MLPQSQLIESQTISQFKLAKSCGELREEARAAFKLELMRVHSKMKIFHSRSQDPRRLLYKNPLFTQ